MSRVKPPRPTIHCRICGELVIKNTKQQCIQLIKLHLKKKHREELISTEKYNENIYKTIKMLEEEVKILWSFVDYSV